MNLLSLPPNARKITNPAQGDINLRATLRPGTAPGGPVGATAQPVGVLMGQAPAPVGPTVMDTMQADKAATKTPSSGGGMNLSNLLLALSAAAHDAAYPQGNRLAETLAGFREQAQQDYMMRRQKLSDDWQQQQQARQQQQWTAQDRVGESLPADQRDRFSADPGAYLASEGARDQYAWQHQYNAEHPEPITPYQQAQIDTARRGQDLDYSAAVARANVSGASRGQYLRGSDRALMDNVRDSATRAQALRQQGQQFLAANGHNATGQMSRFYPSNLWDADRAAMRAAAAAMRSYMRTPGSGATSDYEQRLYAMGVPSVANTGPQNQAIMRNIDALGAIAQARRNFYEDYADQNGSLNGAERAFQQSPEFQQIQREQNVVDPGVTTGSTRASPRRGGTRGSYNPQTGRIEFQQ
jgi:hypothetical protein